MLCCFIEKSLLRQTIEENSYQQNADITGTPAYEGITPEKSPSHGISVDTTVAAEKVNVETVEHAPNTSEQARFDKNSNAVSYHSTHNLRALE